MPLRALTTLCQSFRLPSTLSHWLLLLAAGCAAPIAHSADAVSVSGGNGSNGLDAARVGLQWDWDKTWWQSDYAHLTGDWDLSAAVWHNDATRTSALDDGAETIGAFAFAPVFRLQFNRFSGLSIAPFLELAVGATVLTDRELRTGDRRRRNLGSYFQFEDRAVIGARLGARQQFELAYQRMHYSNLNFASSNTGIDTHLLHMRWHLQPQ